MNNDEYTKSAQDGFSQSSSRVTLSMLARAGNIHPRDETVPYTQLVLCYELSSMAIGSHLSWGENMPK